MTHEKHHDSRSSGTGELFTIPQIAHKAHVSSKTIRRLIARGVLPTHHIGAQIRISEADWQAYLAEARQA